MSGQGRSALEDFWGWKRPLQKMPKGDDLHVYLEAAVTFNRFQIEENDRGGDTVPPQIAKVDEFASRVQERMGVVC